jgi:hypothetical protein
MKRLLPAALCVAVAACGGTAAHRAPQGPPGTPGPGGSAVADRCAAQAAGNPSTMMICLSAHHRTIPDGPRFRACVSGAHDASGAVECMRRLAG